MTRTLPSITAEQCQQITGMTRNHPAHTVYTTRSDGFGVRPMPIGQCPGRRSAAAVTPPADPFAGIPGAHDDSEVQ